MIIPQEYSIQKFLQLSGYPKQKNRGRIIEAGCPICREGNSWGKKRRLYYIIKDDHIFCHNCGWTGNPVKFIQETENKTYHEILEEAKTYDVLPKDINLEVKKEIQQQQESLPHDSINLFDLHQLQYYSDNDVVKKCLDLLSSRRLSTAINRPKTMYVSLTDFTHQNSLILPFYYIDNSIVFYQSRTVIPTEKLPKYLSKVGSEKSLFNVNNIDPELNDIFIFEGPIDACFVRNSVAVAGIQESKSSFTSKQKSQLAIFPLMRKVWVLDSQWQDKAARIKTGKLIESGESVFIWPEEYGTRFKDFNDMAIALGTNEIPHKFILDNSYAGLKARVILSSI